MFDIKELQDRVQHGGIAVDAALEQRILSNALTEQDYAFLSRSMGITRQLSKILQNKYSDNRT